MPQRMKNKSWLKCEEKCDVNSKEEKSDGNGEMAFSVSEKLDRFVASAGGKLADLRTCIVDSGASCSIVTLGRFEKIIAELNLKAANKKSVWIEHRKIDTSVRFKVANGEAVSSLFTAELPIGKLGRCRFYIIDSPDILVPPLLGGDVLYPQKAWIGYPPHSVLIVGDKSVPLLWSGTIPIVKMWWNKSPESQEEIAYAVSHDKYIHAHYSEKQRSDAMDAIRQGMKATGRDLEVEEPIRYVLLASDTKEEISLVTKQNQISKEEILEIAESPTLMKKLHRNLYHRNADQMTRRFNALLPLGSEERKTFHQMAQVVCDTCEVCRDADRCEPHGKGLGIVANYPGHVVVADSVELNLLGIATYVVHLCDVFSRFSLAIIGHDANTTVRALIQWQQLFGRSPRWFMSDSGPEFEASTVRSYCDAHLIEYHHTVIYSPASAGIIERANGTLVALGEKVGSGDADHYDLLRKGDVLSEILSLKNSITTRHGVTSHEIALGYPCVDFAASGDVAFGGTESQLQLNDHFLHQRMNLRKEMADLVRTNVALSDLKKAINDHQHTHPRVALRPGDKCEVKLPAPPGKRFQRARTWEPCIIRGEKGHKICLIEICKSGHYLEVLRQHLRPQTVIGEDHDHIVKIDQYNTEIRRKTDAEKEEDLDLDPGLPESEEKLVNALKRKGKYLNDLLLLHTSSSKKIYSLGAGNTILDSHLRSAVREITISRPRKLAWVSTLPGGALDEDITARITIGFGPSNRALWVLRDDYPTVESYIPDSTFLVTIFLGEDRDVPGDVGDRRENKRARAKGRPKKNKKKTRIDAMDIDSENDDVQQASVVPQRTILEGTLGVKRVREIEDAIQVESRKRVPEVAEQSVASSSSDVVDRVKRRKIDEVVEQEEKRTKKRLRKPWQTPETPETKRQRLQNLQSMIVLEEHLRENSLYSAFLVDDGELDDDGSNIGKMYLQRSDITREEWKPIFSVFNLADEQCAMLAKGELAVKEALQYPDEWLRSTTKELECMAKYGVLRPVPRHSVDFENSEVISTRWVLTWKKKDGQEPFMKARLVARGFEQEVASAQESVTCRRDVVTKLCVLSVQRNWKIMSVDAQTAFLQGDLGDVPPCDRRPLPVFLEPPAKGNPLKDDQVWAMNPSKTIYGTREAPAVWFHSLSSRLKDGGWVQSAHDLGLFLLFDKEKVLAAALALHVDDSWATGNEWGLGQLEKLPGVAWGSIDYDAFRFCGTRFERDNGKNEITLHAPVLDDEKLQICGLNNRLEDDLLDADELTKTRSLVGSLLWVAKWKPDLMVLVNHAASAVTKVSGARLANKALRHYRCRRETDKFVFRKLTEDTDKPMYLLSYCDAEYSFRTGVGYGGQIHLMTGSEPLEAKSHRRVNLLTFNSKKIRRVCKSAKIAELQAASAAEDSVLLHVSQMRELGFNVVGRLLTDSLGLFSNIYSNNPSLAEANFTSHLLAMRETFNPRVQAETPHRVLWICGDLQLADGLTKHKVNGLSLLYNLYRDGCVNLSNLRSPDFVNDIFMVLLALYPGYCL